MHQLILFSVRVPGTEYSDSSSTLAMSNTHRIHSMGILTLYRPSSDVAISGLSQMGGSPVLSRVKRLIPSQSSLYAVAATVLRTITQVIRFQHSPMHPVSLILKDKKIGEQLVSNGSITLDRFYKGFQVHHIFFISNISVRRGNDT